MGKRRKTVANVVTAAVAGAMVLAGAGVSQAETTYNFRLSQFSWFVADICVKTDSDRVCTGKWAKGKSEVFQVKATRLEPWVCTADVESAPDAPEVVFSRSSVKECALEGAPLDPNTKAHFELK